MRSHECYLTKPHSLKTGTCASVDIHHNLPLRFATGLEALYHGKKNGKALVCCVDVRFEYLDKLCPNKGYQMSTCSFERDQKTVVMVMKVLFHLGQTDVEVPKAVVVPV